ncbi:MAG: hypothetical protein PHD30_09550, partial [Paludibacter sp.]|nr:hypothetical protein [Paludibacter sp.]
MKRILLFSLSLLITVLLSNTIAVTGVKSTNQPNVKVSVFDIDVTPPIGYKMPYGTVLNSYDMGLRAKGMVLFGSGQPIVLVAFDWIGIKNECEDAFKAAIATAAGTVPERVAVHVIHQHDAPYASNMKDSFVLSVITRLETAVKNSVEKAVPVTHIGLGEAEVYKVASNRRPLDADGKVKAPRWTSCPDSSLRAEPEGLIDPILSAV